MRTKIISVSYTCKFLKRFSELKMSYIKWMKEKIILTSYIYAIVKVLHWVNEGKNHFSIYICKCKLLKKILSLKCLTLSEWGRKSFQSHIYAIVSFWKDSESKRFTLSEWGRKSFQCHTHAIRVNIFLHWVNEGENHFSLTYIYTIMRFWKHSELKTSHNSSTLNTATYSEIDSFFCSQWFGKRCRKHSITRSGGRRWRGCCSGDQGRGCSLWWRGWGGCQPVGEGELAGQQPPGLSLLLESGRLRVWERSPWNTRCRTHRKLWCTAAGTEGRKEEDVLFKNALNTFYLRLYGVRHMVKDYSDSKRARILLYAPSHRQDNTSHGFCYTSRGALAGLRNSSMGQSVSTCNPKWSIR